MYLLLGALILLAFLTDARSSLIPNRLTLAGVLAGLIFHLFSGGLQGLVYSLAGLCAGFIVLLVLYGLGALGAGDVKLFAAIGAISGVPLTLYSTMYSILYAGCIGICILLWKRQLVRCARRVTGIVYSFILLKDIRAFAAVKREESIRFPFMYAVVPGVITACYYLPQ